MTERVGRYIIGERIASGGMADVFAGELIGADGFRRPVAIKRPRSELIGRAAAAERLAREARLAALLSHDNIASALDFDRDPQGRPYLVMERVFGVDLRALMAAGSVPLPCALAIIGAVLRALGHAHALTRDGEPLGLLHGDVSPHNVMLAWTGAVKLVDFGVARPVLADALSPADAAAAGAADAHIDVAKVRGKIRYMSPEQARGIALDGRSDIFSAGVMCYELLTGARLFAGPEAADSLDLLLRAKIAAPHALDARIPVPVSDACMRMLARDREHRFASARAAWLALAQGRAGLVGTGDDLAALLVERFAERAPPHGPSHALFLRAQAVPQVPSLAALGPRQCARAMFSPTHTRTHPGARATAGDADADRDDARRADHDRARQIERVRATTWIVGALALAGALIALTWWLTHITPR